MEGTLQRFEDLDERSTSAALRCSGRGIRLQHRFGQLDVPVAELVPGELIESRRRVVEPVLAISVLDLREHPSETREDPTVRDRQFDSAFGRYGSCLFGLRQHEARGVPELVAEVAIPRHTAEVEADVAAGRGQRGEREAQSVGAVRFDASGKLLARRFFDLRRELRLHQPGGALRHQRLEIDAVDDVERVDDVALGLRHLVAALVADQAGDVHIPERHVAHELQPEHHHPGDPEEDDVEARHQHIGRVEAREYGILVGPAKGRERPQGRGEPRIQDVGVLAQADTGSE